jgi:hypothetical protein
MIWKYLNQRYPSEGNKWNIILPISLFVGLFMVVFQPFGLSGLESEHKYLILAGYGAVTFTILSFDLFLLPLIFPKALSDENWTVLKEILFMIWVLFSLGLGNLDRIVRVTGNSQGLRIELEGFGEDIPVARNQAAEFREQIARIKG